MERFLQFGKILNVVVRLEKREPVWDPGRVELLYALVNFCCRNSNFDDLFSIFRESVGL